MKTKNRTSLSSLKKYRWAGLLGLMATLPLTVNADLRWADGTDGSFGNLDNWADYGDGTVVPSAPTGNTTALTGQTLRVYNNGSVLRIGDGATHLVGTIYLNNNAKGADGSLVELIQTGGDLTFTGNLQLGRENEGSRGTAAAKYVIGGGSLTGGKVLFGSGAANLFEVTGGTVLLSDRFQTNGGGSMDIKISGGSATAKGLRFDGNNAIGSIEVTGGSLTLNGENSYFGNKENGTLTMTMANDAKLATTSGVGTMGFAVDKNTSFDLTMVESSKISLDSKTILIAKDEGANATITMNDSSRFEATNTASKITFVDGRNTTATLILNDNAAFVSAGTIGLGHHDPDNGGSSVTVTANSGTLFQAQTLIMGRSDNVANSPHSTINLNGGTLAVGVIQVGGGTGTKTINANGGTLQALESGDLVTRIQSAGSDLVLNLQSGGLILDTQTYTVVLASALSGAGGLKKVGSGDLTLAGAGHTYSGHTLVSEGTLIVDTSLASTSVEVEAGAVLLLNGDFLLETATLELLAGAELQVDFAGDQKLLSLMVDGVNVAAGTYTIDELAVLFGGSVSFTDIGGNGTTITVVPEPSTYALWGAAGLLGLVALRRRRK